MLKSKVLSITLMIFIAVVFFFAPMVALAQEQSQGARRALLIGNSAYQKNGLANPVNDATDFGAMLDEAGFTTMVRMDLDLQGMETAVRDFSASLQKGDTALVFYAGHGVESGGVNYLIPVDNAGLESEADLKYKAYAASRIMDEVAAKDAGLMMLILDACRDNPFPSRSGAGPRGLTVMAAPPRMESIILYSTAPGTTAADGMGRNSVFMRSLLAEIQTPDLSVRDVFDRVGSTVKAATGGSQVPWLNSTPLSKPFVFFSGEQAEERFASLSAKAQTELAAEQAKIAELEGARAKAQDEAARQKIETELATAKALEAAKKLESERLTVESARLAEERKKAEAAAQAHKDFEASEAARTAAMQDEVSRLRKEYESLARADDSAPEFIRQISALEKALKEIADRYQSIEKDGEKGIEVVYSQKSDALRASLVMEPWENDKDFSERTKGAYADLDKQKGDELSAYKASMDAEEAGQEKGLKEQLATVSSQFASTVYTQTGSSLAVSAGAFDRDAKCWPIQVKSTAPDFYFQAELRYGIASAPDIGAAYRAFDTALKAQAVTAEVDYSYERESGDDFVPAVARTVRLKDLTTGKTIYSEPNDSTLFYLSDESPGQRLSPPILKVRGALEGTTLTVNGACFTAIPAEIPLKCGPFSVKAEKNWYKDVVFEGSIAPGQVIEKNIVQEKAPLVPMIFVQGGSFMMGSETGGSAERPMHKVTVSSFMIGKYEVTQEQYQTVMGVNPSHFTGDPVAPSHPVEQVSWYDAVTFCNKLSEMEGRQKVYTISGTDVRADFSANGYRLPTEAEWEYAARGGTLSKNYLYSGSDNLSQVAWYAFNSDDTTHSVGTRAPNELGLYDMSGNVWEWCWDWYGSYTSAIQSDPRGASSGGYRVERGESYCFASYLSITYRSCDFPNLRNNSVGFRVVRRP